MEWSKGVGHCSHGPGVPSKHEGRDGAHSMRAQTQTTSTHSCWQLDSERCGFVVPEGHLAGGDAVQAAWHSTPALPWWAGREHCCRHTPEHGRGHVSPGARVKVKEKQDKEKPSQELQSEFKLPHQAHPLSADGDSVMNRER